MAKATPTADNTEAAAEWVEIDALREWKDNPRKNDGEPVRKVVESIKRFGFGAPIIARKANGEIIAGHTRFKAAKELGLHRVPVRFLDLDPADAHLLALADNRLNEEAAWDSEKLAAILSLMQAEGVEVEASGFGAGELDVIMSSLHEHSDLHADGSHGSEHEIVDMGETTLAVKVQNVDASRAKEAIASALDDAGIEAKVEAR